MGLTVVLLAYHEAENLKWLLPELKKVIEQLNLDKVEFLVIDSAVPTDDTKEVCSAFGARYVPQEEPGYGGAYRTAIRYAHEEWFLILDADASQDYTQIPKMYEVMRQGADLVIGSRYVAGAKSDDSSLSRLMSHILNFAFRVATGVKIHDFSDSLRICRTQDLRALYLQCVNFDISEELILKLRLTYGRSYNIQEVPITFKKRQIGESKRSLFKFIISFGRLLVYCFVLRLLAREKYIPQIQDAQAWKITNRFLFCMVEVLGALAGTALYCALFGAGVFWPAANLVSWLLVLPLAFLLDKIIVANVWKWDAKTLQREIPGFIQPRIFAIAMEFVLLVIAQPVKWLPYQTAKAATALVVVIVNCLWYRACVNRDHTEKSTNKKSRGKFKKVRRKEESNFRQDFLEKE